MSRNGYIYIPWATTGKPGETYVAVGNGGNTKRELMLYMPTICFSLCRFVCDRKPWNIWLQCRDECAYCQQNAYQYSKLVTIR